jgi:hypothetical protein
MLRLQNRYVPQWARRIANGVMASPFLALAAARLTSTVASDSLPWKTALVLIYSSPAALFASLLNPNKITLADGIAGEDRCDELT